MESLPNFSAASCLSLYEKPYNGLPSGLERHIVPANQSFVKHGGNKPVVRASWTQSRQIWSQDHRASHGKATRGFAYRQGYGAGSTRMFPEDEVPRKYPAP